jgi:integrase
MALPTIPPTWCPRADVAVYGLQRRAGERHQRPWIVRWSLTGRQRSRSFRTRAEAERYRAGLILAVQRGEPFDSLNGEPASWQPSPGEMKVHVWARRWLAESWLEWAPRTRNSAVEALTRLVPLAVHPMAPAPPAGMRQHLVVSLRPDAEFSPSAAESWLDQWGLALAQLTRPILADVDLRLGRRDDGRPLGAATAARFRKVSRSCIRRAVDLGVLDTDPWPPPPRGRSKRKSVRIRRSVQVRTLPDPDTMAAVIEAMVSHQPASRTYQMMTAVVYYAGLRPSEVVMLRADALGLPGRGWGHIEVTEADVDFDQPGEPKTGPRTVPIPPVLVSALRSWIADHGLEGADLLFRTRSGRRPRSSNWCRCLQRALRQVGQPPLRVYDCRHAAATTWLGAGVPLGEVAKRMGHSVETLVSTYVGALSGDAKAANARIEAVLGPPVD